MEHFFSDLFAGRDRFALDVIVDTERTPAELIAHIARVVCDPQRSRRRLYLLGREDGADPCMTLPMWAFFGGGAASSSGGGAGATMMTRVKRLLIPGVRISNEASGGGSRHDIGWTEFTAHVAGQWRHDNASSSNLMEGFEGVLRTLLRERSPMMSNLLPEGIPANHRNVIIVSDRMVQNTFAALAGCRDVRICIPGKDDVLGIISGRTPRRHHHAPKHQPHHTHNPQQQNQTPLNTTSSQTTFFGASAPRRHAWGVPQEQQQETTAPFSFSANAEDDGSVSDVDTSDGEEERGGAAGVTRMPRKETCAVASSSASASKDDMVSNVWDLPDGDDWEWTRWRQPTTTHSVADAMRPVSVSESEND